jgi:hypothetical protein
MVALMAGVAKTVRLYVARSVDHCDKELPFQPKFWKRCGPMSAALRPTWIGRTTMAERATWEY